MADHGQKAATDRVMLWFEDCYSKIRTLPWSWNFANTNTVTEGPITGASLGTPETYDWTQGSSHISVNGGAATTLPPINTGRFVYIGDEWYRLIGIGEPSATYKITLDRPISEATATEQSLTFYRRDISLNSSGLKSFTVDQWKLDIISNEQIHRYKRGLDPRWYYGDAGTPLAYTLENEYRIDPPTRAPTTGKVKSATPVSSGTHELFWVYRDQETGLESAPGPSSEIVADGTTAYSVYYGDSSINVGDRSFQLILYASKAKDEFARPAMYQVGTKVSFDSASFVTYDLSDSNLIEKTRYYDGPYTNCNMWPAPDEVLRIECNHLNGWQGRPDNSDYIEFGDNNEFTELFILYFVMKQSSQNKSPKEMRAAQVSFREQLDFLLSRDGDNSRLDPDSWSYRFMRPEVEDNRDDNFIASIRYPF